MGSDIFFSVFDISASFIIVKAVNLFGVKMLTPSTKPKIDRNNLFLINANLLILYKTINQNHHF